MPPSRLPATRTKDLERVLGRHLGFQASSHRTGGSHEQWFKTFPDGRVLTATLLRARTYRPRTLRHILDQAQCSVQSYVALFHGVRKGRQVSNATATTHLDLRIR